MNRHSGLGRHSPSEDTAGDPLDGLVNLFDIGIVLAVAFLIAGLGLTLDRTAHRVEKRIPPTGRSQAISTPAGTPEESGRGEAVGTVYRLSDGQLMYVKRQTR
ncbi:MAG TPA: DUF2149 domain-containing protein [Solirubrobacteraceae bacterium]|nr:DUF2149 domain-containing protein [Solirubrobacteraceae bacterium]